MLCHSGAAGSSSGAHTLTFLISSSYASMIDIQQEPMEDHNGKSFFLVGHWDTSVAPNPSICFPNLYHFLPLSMDWGLLRSCTCSPCLWKIPFITVEAVINFFRVPFKLDRNGVRCAHSGVLLARITTAKVLPHPNSLISSLGSPTAIETCLLNTSGSACSPPRLLAPLPKLPSGQQSLSLFSSATRTYFRNERRCCYREREFWGRILRCSRNKYF
ncbi:hypothetical protein DL93DRAFT_2111912 [Clavulina sp. PMI_390]|nr:hypothetical protein DL93DRAFT_2111912 [Clavulina sp. PMI_390]